MTTLAQAVAAYCSALLATTRRRMITVQRDERGSTTIQEVLWAIAAIAFVAIVVAAIKAFLDSQVAKIH